MTIKKSVFAALFVFAVALPGALRAQIQFTVTDEKTITSDDRMLHAADFGGGPGDDVTAIGCSSGNLVIRPTDANGILQTAFAGFSVGSGCYFGTEHGDFNRDGCNDVAIIDWCNDRLLTAAGHCDGTFAPYTSYPAPVYTIGVQVGDLNEDGLLDIIVGGQTTSVARVYLGNGNGGFTAQSNFNTGAQTRWIEFGRLNNDTHLDLAIAGMDGKISVMMGNGNGTFGPPTTYQAGDSTSFVGIADFNRDGCQDILADNYEANNVMLYTGNCTGAFVNARTITVGNGPHGLVVDDFDQDGKADFAVSNRYSQTVLIFAGNGDGTFASPITFNSTRSIFNITGGDFDHDGMTDLVFSTPSSDSITVLMNRSTPPDQDGDGLTRAQEIALGTDPLNPDTDGDGMPDGWEANALNATNPLVNDAASDRDADDVSNLAEYQAGLYANRADSEADGMPDGWEVSHASCDLNPLVGDSIGDPDGDGLSNLQEFSLGLDPCVSADSDGDGLTDADEIALYGTNPYSADSDNDRLSDYDEVIIWLTDPNDKDSDGDELSDWSEINYHNSNPLLWDSDGDGLSDGLEVATGTASNKNDTDSDSMPDAWEKSYACVNALVGDADLDADGDGLTNLEEFTIGSHPCVVDTDSDGLSDHFEFETSMTDPANPDSDGDGLTDGDEVNNRHTLPLDFDTDDDGFSDGNEVANGTDPLDPNSHPEPAGRFINYHGRLADAGGMPVNGTLAVTFRVYETAAGGLPLWTETQTVTVVNGIYNVMLGTVTPWPEIFNRPELFLEVEVGGQAMVPRSRFGYVPFAFHCDEAFGGRMEIDERALTIVRPNKEILVHVSFKKVFTNPPKVVVSPPTGDLQGKRFVPAEVNNITGTGFDVTFQSLTGAAASGNASFTYFAFGQ